MNIKLLLFGVLADIVGEKSLNLEEKDIKSTDDLLRYTKTRYPELEKYKFQVSVNQSIITENTILKNKDEVALLPPFAGG